ncbi:MAG: glycosyltransferase family 2 protein [Prolixibacteraceae bacterium]|jgi:hypothetical protein|nr:glycosyltransferase family 2 protein [Prolixibacteraceae bacterium]MDD4755130.1 glycosyltransferase family 2 protein [Prolixibacteraceae bacterium]NLO03084.1 glycosyltransferase family 2 protein [Bacteroidales bacterium]
MKVCGFTFIKNAVKYDFPVVEAITSVLPVCDHFVVAVGHSDDGTREIIEKIDPGKITITDTVWDDTLKRGGEVYAVETNKAFDAVPPEYDWCFYIQCDEVIHEKYLTVLKNAMYENLERNEVDGLLFGFRHFYGTYDFVGDSRRWYRNEIRIIRNDKSIRSYRDAQGFRKDGRKLKVVQIPADVYHYGWVRPPKSMQQKIAGVKQYYDGVNSVQKMNDNFNYSKNYDSLAKFEGTHPAVMKQRISRMNWHMDADLKKINMKLKYKILYRFEKLTGIRLFEYRNYSLLNS